MKARLSNGARAGLLALLLPGALLLGEQGTRAQEVTGVLLSPAGEQAYPIPEAKLQLCGVGDDVCHSTYTDGDGVFRFDSITAGEYELKTMGKSGGVAVSERLRVAPGSKEVLRVISR